MMQLHVRSLLFVVTLVLCGTSNAPAQEPPLSVFRSSVDVVSVTAVVRDRRGLVVPSLTRDDFEVVDSGLRRPILDLRSELSAPVSVAILIDGSGSMGLGTAPDLTRRIGRALLRALEHERDEAALLTFDTRLVTVRHFANDLEWVRTGLDEIEAWGSTSLYDAIAGTAGILARHARHRRAVIVLTDGWDNASAYTPDEVSRLASTIDVPVYVFSLSTPRPAGTTRAGQTDALTALARATGGDLFEAHGPGLAGLGLRRLLEELRHQYVLSFEASALPGLRRVEIRTRRTHLRVKARGFYLAGHTE